MSVANGPDRKRYAVVAAGILLSGCITARPSTQIQSIWKNPGFTPGIARNILVIGVFPVPERRRMFEEEFAKSIRKYGPHTVCSYQLFPSLEGVTRATIEGIVKEKQLDAVIITRLIDKKTIETSVPGTETEVPPSPMDGAVSYFNESEKTVSTPGYTVDQSVVVLETKYFETHQGACVWICRSDTLVNGYLDDLIRSFAQVMTLALYEPRAH